MEQQGLRKELESAEEDKEALQQRLLDSDIHAPRHAALPSPSRMLNRFPHNGNLLPWMAVS